MELHTNPLSRNLFCGYVLVCLCASFRSSTWRSLYFKLIFHFFLIQGVNFIGRDALLEKRKEMLSKKLVCLTLDTDCIDAEGNETIWYEGRVRIN